MSQLAFVTREPVLTRRHTITANRLLIHASNTEQALATVRGLFAHWPRAHSVFVSFVRLAPQAGLLQAAWPENTFLEVPTQALALPTLSTFLHAATEHGTPLCLSWHDGKTPFPDSPLWRFSITDVRRSSQPGNAPGIALAWGLRSLEEAAALPSGFSGTVGWHFLAGTTARRTTDEPAPSRSILLRAISMVKAEAGIGEIEAVLKQDVALGYRLLRYLNSPAMGLRVEITSLRQAIGILGYRPMLRWLSALYLHSHPSEASAAFAQTAFVRGRYLELIAQEYFSAGECEELFLCGLFSVLPALTGQTMQQALEGLTLPSNVIDALCEDSGPFAPFLRLVRASESASPTAVVASAEELAIRAEKHNAALVAALEYADQLAA